MHLLLAIPAVKRDPAPPQELPYPSWFFPWFCSIPLEAGLADYSLSSFLCGLLPPTKVVFFVVVFILLFAAFLQVFLRFRVTLLVASDL